MTESFGFGYLGFMYSTVIKRLVMLLQDSNFVVLCIEELSSNLLVTNRVVQFESDK